jgi:hypothetical protein
MTGFPCLQIRNLSNGSNSIRSELELQNEITIQDINEVEIEDQEASCDNC